MKVTHSKSLPAFPSGRVLRGDQPQRPQTEDIERQRERLCFLPTAEDPVLWRALGKSGYGLFLYLESGLDFETLGRLADAKDRAGVIKRAAAEVCS